MIGGFVRDILLERDHKKDIDIVAVGSGIELALKVSELIPFHPKVQVFKTMELQCCATMTLMWSLLALEKNLTHDSRNPLVENGTLKDDQERRDFTINALAFSLNSENFGDLVDPFNGVEDLKKQNHQNTFKSRYYVFR